MAAPSQLTGQTISHYRIMEKLGGGGMGVVYRATDLRLGRDVALKVLPQDVANDPERLARFQREARAVAALNHPNVVTLHSVEEYEGVPFLTMELVEGQPLDHLISATGLPFERIVEIASAVAEALAAAHEKGILHRDLKPANVMVTNEGRVKVLDFGLAKDVHAENPDNVTLTSAGHTQAGMVMGTPAYMSPEQVSGRSLDHRTDIFSLGVVLHEMATGRRPFEGASSAELMSAILRDTPPYVTEVRGDLPSDLARVIRRCMEKDPGRRVQTAREVSTELRHLCQSAPITHAASSLPVSRPEVKRDSAAARADEGFWVAVLPFKYSGSNPDLNAVAEGLTDDVVTGLCRFSYLKVISRSLTSRYTNETVDLRVVARELGAHYVMEGSLRQAGTKVRIGAQLVDRSGASLWAEMYDRLFRPDAVFELADDVVPCIVSTVADTQGILPHNMTEALRNRDPDTFTPYEALLRSFGHHQRLSPAEHAVARAALERAVQQPPERGDCWAMLSWLYREEYTHGFNPRPDPLGRALTAAHRAIDAAPSNHLAHAALAAALFFRHEMGAFRASAERSLALNPMDGLTHAYLGFQIAYSGDWERGCALAERAMQLNPHHPGWYWFPFVLDAYRQREYQKALDLVLKVNMAGFWRTQLMLAACNAQLGNQQAARDAAQELLKIRSDFATVARIELEKWWDPGLVEHLLEGLRKAGLEVTIPVKTPLLHRDSGN